MPQLIQQKVESWLALALAEVADSNRLPIYTGEATETNRKRPSIVIICERAINTPPFLWRDNERTATVSVYLSSPADASLSNHAARCAALEAALQDNTTVNAFAAQVESFFLYQYDVNDVDQQRDDSSRSVTTIYTLTVKCRDDAGNGTT